MITKLDYIQYLCEKKLKALGLEKDQAYIQRIERELTNIDVQNLQDYVLTQINQKIKVEKHTSLIYFLLDISQTDPIKNNLQLVIKKPSSFPDIDSDFSINEREMVIKYFIAKYGSDHVAPIGSYGQMKMKMVTRDIARIFDIDLNDTNEVVKNLGDDVDTMTEEDFDVILSKEPGEEGFRNDLYALRQYFGRYPEIREIIFMLKGQLRHLTKHPAGVVAVPTNIDETIPLMRHKDELITSWVDGIIRKDLQSSGFIKFDILGLRTLTIVKEILEMIRERKSYKPADFDLESIDKGQITSILYEEFSSKLPLDGNKEVYEKFQTTDTNGIFQFECVAGNTWIGNYRIEELYDKFNSNPNDVHKIGCVDLKHRVKIRQQIRAMKKQVRDVYRLVLVNKQCIEITDLHEFFAKVKGKNGWKQLQELAIGDKVLVDQERCRSQYFCETSNEVIESIRTDDICNKCEPKTCSPKVLSQYKKKYKRRYRFVSIKSITFIGPKTVYDIGFDVKQRHNYIANGFVVHNSNLMKSLLKEIKPTSFSDITTATALGRPGPLDMGMHHEYAARKHGKAFDFGSPLVEKCLKDSFGILVYQEDVMRLCHMVAGFPLDLTDTVRKNLMKSIRDKDAKDKEAKQRKEIHDKFIKGCADGGLKESIAENWWQSCVSFARYGFNKSHAVAYTVLSYQMMWFKVYYPLEFYVVLFTNSIKDKFGGYFGEALSKGIEIQPVDINKAKQGFTIQGDNCIMFGIAHITGVGPAIVNTIVQTQPYSSFEDFWNKTSEIKKISKTAVTALISAHAFDCFGTQNEILELYFKKIRGEDDWERTIDYEDKKFEHDMFVEAYSVDWRAKLTEPQKQELKKLEAKLLTKIVQPKPHFKQQVWGIITEIIERKSKAGNDYYNLILTDSKFNIAKVRIPTYNRRCKFAFMLNKETGKYKKVGVVDLMQQNNIIVGEAETSEYMGRVFVDLFNICCIGNVYEKSIEQKERMAKYDEMYKEIS